jgi:DNA-binding beta-propeller fold protein YncE
VGIAQSPDHHWLYVTSMQRRAGPTASEGTLSVLSLARAETRPADAVVATAIAGCGPVRVVTSSDGSVVWVTARESNALLAFSAAELRSDPAHSLIAKVAVGQTPIGAILIDGGKKIVVADADIHNPKNAAFNLEVVSTATAPAGKPALLSLISSGLLPRQFVLEAGGKTLLVTNSTSGTLQAVDLAGLP